MAFETVEKQMVFEVAEDAKKEFAEDFW